MVVTAEVRRGELQGLRWEDVDLEAEPLQVCRMLSEPRGGSLFEAPKRGKGRNIRRTQRASRAPTRGEDGRGALWQDPRLHLWYRHAPIGGNLNRAFKATLQRAGLSAVRSHDLHHTCATLLLRQSVNPKYVQELLGHADIALTLNVYSRVLPDMDDAAAGAMDAALG